MSGLGMGPAALDTRQLGRSHQRPDLPTAGGCANRPPTAVAADAQQQSAAAAAEPCLTADHLSLARTIPCHCSDHNVALKYARDCEEHTQQGCKKYSLDKAEKIPLLFKPQGSGPNYDFRRDGQNFTWHFSLMLSNLRDDHLRLVVDGPNGTGGHIVKCSCQITADYDHKREFAEKNGHATWRPQSTKHSQWDFVLVRADQSSCWLHPNWGDNKVAYGEITADAAVEVIQPPSTGRGGSGPKLFTYFKNSRVDQVLRFDRSKNEVKQHRDSQTADAV